MKRTGIKTAARWVLALFVAYAGVAHFRHPEPFVKIVPDYLPAPGLLVAVSGFFEIVGGIGLLVPVTRRAAALGLIALFVAVFPANVNMAVHHLPLAGISNPVLLWLRLPLQFVLIAWAAWLAKPDKEPS